MSDMMEFCGLWENTSKAGKKYYSGRLGNAKLMLFKVPDEKRTERGPAMRIMIAPWETREAPGTPIPDKATSSPADDDIPF